MIYQCDRYISMTDLWSMIGTWIYSSRIVWEKSPHITVWKVCIAQRISPARNFDAFYIFSIKFFKSPACNFPTFQQAYVMVKSLKNWVFQLNKVVMHWQFNCPPPLPIFLLGMKYYKFISSQVVGSLEDRNIKLLSRQNLMARHCAQIQLIIQRVQTLQLSWHGS